MQPTADSSQPGADPASAAGPAVGAARRRPRRHDVDAAATSTSATTALVLYGAVTRSASTFVYRVRATNAGAFQVPPAFAEGMYDRIGRPASARPTTLEVVKP